MNAFRALPRHRSAIAALRAAADDVDAVAREAPSAALRACSRRRLHIVGATALALIVLPPAGHAADATPASVSATAAAATATAAADSSDQAARDAGLTWLADRQRDDGGWNGAADPDGPAGWEDNGDDCVATALALSACLGSGAYDPSPVADPPVKRSVHMKSGLTFLVDHQQDDGGYGATFPTAVVIGTLAGAYAYFGHAYVWPTQHGLNVLRARQTAAGAWGVGWPTTVCDTRVTAWCVLTMETCIMPRLRPGPALCRAVGWLAGNFQVANPAWSGFDPARDAAGFPLRTAAAATAPAAVAADAPTADPQAIAAAAICAHILGQPPEQLRELIIPDSTPTAEPDPPAATVSATTAALMAATLGNRLVSPAILQAASHDALTAYLGTLAAAQLDDAHWQVWRTHVVDALRAAQHRDPGALAGSWDPPTPPTGFIDGRVAVTALSIMTLEVANLHDHPPEVQPPADIGPSGAPSP